MPPCSCPVLPSIMDLQCESVHCTNPLSPLCLWPWCFFTAIVTLTRILYKRAQKGKLIAISGYVHRDSPLVHSLRKEYCKVCGLSPQKNWHRTDDMERARPQKSQNIRFKSHPETGRSGARSFPVSMPTLEHRDPHQLVLGSQSYHQDG